jgi:hypothetical protein
MSSRYDLGIDPLVGMTKNAYLGIHLRTDSDAVKMGWSTYSEQTAHYLKLVEQSPLSVIYVASGNNTSVELLAAEAALEEKPKIVVTKTDLLEGDDLKLLQSMTWDQQALVDYSILLKSSMFGGMSASSFSWNIALRRRSIAERGTCEAIHDQWWRGANLPKGSTYRDELSDIMGDALSDFEDRGWP